MNFGITAGRDGPLTYGHTPRSVRHVAATKSKVTDSIMDYKFIQRQRMREARLIQPRRPASSHSQHSPRHSAWLGPGRYSPRHRITNPRASSVKMRSEGNGARRRPKNSPFDPGPGSYDPQYPRDTRPQSKAGLYTRDRFGGSRAATDRASGPAPGAYDVKYMERKPPKVHFGAPSFPRAYVNRQCMRPLQMV